MNIDSLLNNTDPRNLAESLLDRLHSYIVRQRWYGGKARSVRQVTLQDASLLSLGDHAILMLLCRYVYADGIDYYQVPLLLAWWDSLTATVDEAIASVEIEDRDVLVVDALKMAEGRAALFRILSGNAPTGPLRVTVTTAGRDILPRIDPDNSRLLSLEQSNSSVLYEGPTGQRVFLKLYRRVEAGPSPELELGRYLTEQANLPSVPRMLAAMEYVPGPEAEAWTLAVAQEFVPNKGDAWSFLLRLMEEEARSATLPDEFPVPDVAGWRNLSRTPIPGEFHELHRRSLNAAAELGHATGVLHRALGAAQDPDSLKPVALDRAFIEQLLNRIYRQVEQALTYLEPAVHTLADEEKDLADRVRRGLSSFAAELRNELTEGPVPEVQRIRVHGDYHLGQVLVDDSGRFVIIDFEGEPARSLAERRAKELAFKDVAGMLRSFDYAAHTVAASVGLDPRERRTSWARAWSAAAVASFLAAYDEHVTGTELVPHEDDWYNRLLTMYVFEKACYELLYELNNRPDWVGIPLAGIASLLGSGT